ncbi:uncharacterized protein LOC143200086 isoform X2 [Rhynchophorus ferrugineus]|uniref:uncharacterized protein LOC143200086 isoform X2 n=1 Tax=Rhynchophorus ferrugineus TaxID=354439 RepID=UPI003FCD42AA
MNRSNSRISGSVVQFVLDRFEYECRTSSVLVSGVIFFQKRLSKYLLSVLRKWDVSNNVIHLIISTMKFEPEFLNYWFWIGTVAALCSGLLFSLLSAVFAVINTVKTMHRCLTGLSGLILWNFLTCLSSVCGIGLFIAQYYTTIQYNVLTREDRANEWTSEGMAEFSYSFWFVVGAACAAFVNIIVVVISTSETETETIIPVLEEKTNGAIMLY